MAGRDDFGSRAGTPGGMGGSLGNGGVGGGMGGGMRGGGAGYNGGIGSRMGVTTGNVMQGTSAYGRPGGMAQGYGMSPMAARQAAMAAQQGIMAKLQQGVPRPAAAPPPQVMQPVGMPPPQNPIMSMPNYMPQFMDPIQGPNFFNTAGAMSRPMPPMTMPPGGKYQDRVPPSDGGWPGQATGPRWGRTESAPYGGVGNRGNTGGGGGW